MNKRQKLFDEYAEFLLYKGYELEGLGFNLEGQKIENVSDERIKETFELVDEINKTTQEFKSKFYEVRNG